MISKWSVVSIEPKTSDLNPSAHQVRRRRNGPLRISMDSFEKDVLGTLVISNTKIVLSFPWYRLTIVGLRICCALLSK